MIKCTSQDSRSEYQKANNEVRKKIKETKKE